MLTFLKEIWQIIVNLVNFVIHSIESIFVLLSHIPRFIAYLTGIMAEMPSLYTAVMLVTITISIIFLIINRGK